MKKMKKKFNKGEIFKVRNSRKLYAPFYMMIIVLLGVLVYIQYTGKPLNDMAFKMVLAFSVALIIATEIHRFGNLYEINDKSIIHTTGYFNILSKRVEFGAISDIDILQGPWQRIFKFGHITLFKFAEGPTLKNINRPKDFVNYLEEKMAISRTEE